MARATREQWEEHVRRWADSRLTAKDYAAEAGINANTLTHWKWRLAAEARGTGAPDAVSRGRGFLELSMPPLKHQRVCAAPSVGGQSAEPFEVVLREGLRVRVPSQFDPESLRLLISTLEGR